uniref:Uncharacterized protein n=1 Tax=Neovison vison TaxID=452646 RepID=A0A8C7A4R9_NEOVI
MSRDQKAMINNASMSEETEQDCVECAAQALEEQDVEKTPADRPKGKIANELVLARWMDGWMF